VTVGVSIFIFVNVVGFAVTVTEAVGWTVSETLIVVVPAWTSVATGSMIISASLTTGTVRSPLAAYAQYTYAATPLNAASPDAAEC
jgi:hypothetical protein